MIFPFQLCMLAILYGSFCSGGGDSCVFAVVHIDLDGA